MKLPEFSWIPIIYEVADLHRLLVDKQTGIVRKVAQKYLCYEDRRLEKYYDLLIITSQKYYEVYFGGFVAENKVLFMPNVPDLSAFKTYKHKKEQLPFTVGYIGAVRYKKQMMNLLTAATECGCNLLIAGYEDEPVVIQPLCQTNPNIEWVGRFDFNARAAELYGRCDVMYSVYDADMNNVRVAIPNKLYEAVFCEMPLIVARDTYLASIGYRGLCNLCSGYGEIVNLCRTDRQIRDLGTGDRAALNFGSHNGSVLYVGGADGRTSNLGIGNGGIFNFGGIDLAVFDVRGKDMCSRRSVKTIRTGILPSSSTKHTPARTERPLAP